MKIILQPENVPSMLNKNGKVDSNKSRNYIPHPDWYWCKTTAEYIYCVIHDIRVMPICQMDGCENNTKYTREIKKGYSPYCSYRCNMSDKSKQPTIEITPEDLKNILRVDGIIDKHKSRKFHLPTNSYRWVNSIKEYKYCIDNNINNQPICNSPKCKKRPKFQNTSYGYGRFCGHLCAANNEEKLKRGVSTRRERGSWRSEEEMELYDVYINMIHLHSKQQWGFYKTIKDFNRTGKNGVYGAFQMDHIISKKEGFKRGVLPCVIGDILNLQMIPWEENNSKRDNCYSVIDQCNHIKQIYYQKLSTE